MAEPTKEPKAPVLSPVDQKAANLKAKIDRLTSYKQTPDVVAAIARAQKHLSTLPK